MSYDDARAWRHGPHAVYRRFAAAALDALGSDVNGLSTLDAGCGAGAMGEELALRGARAVYLDREFAMVREAPLPRVVGDISALPVRDRCVDLAAANLVLSHVDNPWEALGQLVRVTRPGGTVLATAFFAGDQHPVKQAVDEVLASYGYQAPDWYQRVKRDGEARVGDLPTLTALGRAAGLHAVRVAELAVSLTGLGPDALLAWRLGMPSAAMFVSQLPVARRDGLAAAARAALPAQAGATPVRLLALTGEAP